MKVATADFLRGEIVCSRGSIADYRELSHLHYVPGDPATVCGVWCAWYREARGSRAEWRRRRKREAAPSAIPDGRLIGVAVLSYPTPSSRARDRTFQLSGGRYGERLRWINAHVRTISRVIVHPQFRALGVATALVRRVLEECPTRYVEAMAAMGAVHPFFARAGMKIAEPTREGEAAYFWFDRESGPGAEAPGLAGSNEKGELS